MIIVKIFDPALHGGCGPGIKRRPAMSSAESGAKIASRRRGVKPLVDDLNRCSRVNILLLAKQQRRGLRHPAELLVRSRQANLGKLRSLFLRTVATLLQLLDP